MKRLIKINGIGEKYLQELPGDTVTVYHGTSAENYYSILENGLVNGGGTSYQVNGIVNQEGIWVTLNKSIAEGYARQAAQGYMKQDNDDDFTGYGVIFEFIVNKNDLSDEGSGVMNNFKMKVPVTPSMISSGHAYVINIKDNSEYQSY